VNGKMTMTLIGHIWKLSPRAAKLKRSPTTMRMSLMMSDLLGTFSIALLPFWCLDAKGGEVVLFRIFSRAFFLGVLVGHKHAMCFICRVFMLVSIYIRLWTWFICLWRVWNYLIVMVMIFVHLVWRLSSYHWFGYYHVIIVIYW
jgi:hypothetical protein